MPDVTSGFGKNNARINGGFGKGLDGRVTACSLGVGTNGGSSCKAVPYFSNQAFQAPANINPAGVFIEVRIIKFINIGGPKCIQTNYIGICVKLLFTIIDRPKDMILDNF